MLTVKIKRGVASHNVAKKVHVIKHDIENATTALCGERIRNADKFEIVIGEIDCARCKDRYAKHEARRHVVVTSHVSVNVIGLQNQL